MSDSIARRLDRLEQRAVREKRTAPPKGETDFDAIERKLIEVGGPDAVERLNEEIRQMKARWPSLWQA